MADTSWAEMLVEAMQKAGDAGPLLHCTLTPEQMAARFCAGFGLCQGRPFTAWTEQRVYFPVDFDGSEWAASVPRHPCSEATVHVGKGGMAELLVEEDEA